MAIQMQTSRFEFPSLKGVQQQLHTVFFSGSVQRAVAMIQGFDIHFDNNEHPVLQERIQLDINSINGGTVNILATFLIRDNSRDRVGNIDDPYSGSVNAVVIADVA